MIILTSSSKHVVIGCEILWGRGQRGRKRGEKLGNRKTPISRKGWETEGILGYGVSGALGLADRVSQL